MKSEYFSIDARFCGPPRSANGGYVCGLMAGRLASRLAGHLAGGGAVTVRLKAPPPLAERMRLDYSDTGAKLTHGATLVAEAKAGVLGLDVPPAPAWSLAETASRGFVGFTHHQFPGCFVCGTGRLPGDGLRLFPGAMPGGPVVAAPWIPDASLRGDDGKVAPEFLWAALDCPGTFAIRHDTANKTLVLGEFCAAVGHDIRPGEHCVVVAWPLRSEGRKFLAGTAVFRGDRLIAHAQATWIEVPLADWT